MLFSVSPFGSLRAAGACFFYYFEKEKKMSKNSINQMLAGLEAELKAGIEDGEGAKASAAERLGRALLESFGKVEGMSEDELVDALLSEWGRRAETAKEAAPAETAETAESAEPFGAVPKLPVPSEQQIVDALGHASSLSQEAPIERDSPEDHIEFRDVAIGQGQSPLAAHLPALA